MQHALAKQKYGNTKELWCQTLQLFKCIKILWEAAITRLRDEIVTVRCSLTQRQSVIFQRLNFDWDHFLQREGQTEKHLSNNLTSAIKTMPTALPSCPL
jgi:dynactin complex subunit